MRHLIFVTAAAFIAVGCSSQPGSTSATGSGADPVATAGTADSRAAERSKAPDAVREVTLPAGTELPIVLDTAVSSDASRAEQPVDAHVSRPITVGGETVLPEGSSVNGVVTDATEAGRVKGRAHVSVRFDSLTPRGADERYRIDTTAIARTAEATKEKDALEIGGGAAAGALIGSLVGGGKGALIGTAAGGGAGTAVVLSTRGKEVRLAKGAALRLRLTEPVTIKVRS